MNILSIVHRISSVASGCRGLVAAVLIVLAAGCSDSDDGPDGGLTDNNDNRACTLEQEKAAILSIMEEWYLWNDTAEQAGKYAAVDLDEYSNGAALLDYLRYRQDSRDRGFTHITTPEEEQAFYGAGQYVGFGFSFLKDAVTDDIRASQVFAGSPADEAGIERGYTLRAIDGNSVQTMSGAQLQAALGPDEEGVTRTFQVADRSGNVSSITLTKSVVTIDPVPVATVIRDNSDAPIAGYLVLRTFIGPAEDALREAFADFGDAGIERLIVDLRYNGGGQIRTAAIFATLLAGPANTGNPFIDFEFNSDRAADNNYRQTFVSEANAIDLSSIVFITTEFSASASELVISGLQPYFDTGAKELAGVGGRTFGKPVGQSAFDFCDDTMRLRAVTLKSVNADGDGDYFNGLPVDCAVTDDLQLPFGDESESMLSVALNYIETGGACATADARRRIAAQSGDTAPVTIGGTAPWERYAGAH